MRELHYQLDLLKAMNLKLSGKEKMYRLVSSTSNNAFLYYSFERNEFETLGKWSSFFDFDIERTKDLELLFEQVDEPYVDAIRSAFYPEKRKMEEDTLTCKLKNKEMWLELKTNVFKDESGKITDKVLTITDITRVKKQNEELAYMAYYDNMTTLYNRNYFTLLLTNMLEKAEKKREIVSVMVVDIDDFHNINDGLGMIMGDDIVQQLAYVLKDFTGEDVIACRIDRDSYCLAIYSPSGEKSVTGIHKRLIERLEKPFIIGDGQEVMISVSVGVAEYPESAKNALELINCAEIVMYKGKKMVGKNTIQYFDTPILNEFLQNVQIDNRLKDAVFKKNFTLKYQPQFHAKTGRIRGMEVLIRWLDEDSRNVPPSVFIPIAEKNGTIISIGNWVMEESVRQYSEWRRRFGLPLILSINVSPLQYVKDDFVVNLLQLLEKYHVNPTDVEVEITENVLIEDLDLVMQKLKTLREYGIRVSLDDFGTGFSSLSYLKKLPIDTLKIDKSFIDTVLNDGASRIILESMITMVKSLGLETIAEGVELKEQYKYIKSIGCDVIQGFYLSHPLDAQQMEVLLSTMLFD